MKTSGVARSIGHRFEKERYTLSALTRTHLIHTMGAPMVWLSVLCRSRSPPLVAGEHCQIVWRSINSSSDILLE